ncbi:MAG: hypothetical protein ABEJ66_02565 [Candidatus Nanohaloarchaea archaeon]
MDYAKSRGLKGIIHTDEDLENYDLDQEFEQLAERMEREEDDVLAVLAGPTDQAEGAAEAVKQRAEKLYRGEVPEETRDAEQDFTTSYSRPLPGAARMYPETDIPAIEVTEEEVEEIDQNLPATLEEKEEKYAQEIGEELASQLVYGERLPMFEQFRDRVDTKLAANVFVNTLPHLENDGVPVGELEEHHFEAVFDSLAEGELEKGHVADVLAHMASNPQEEPEEALEEVLESKAGEDEIRKAVKDVLDEKEEMVEEQGMRAQGALMGIVMQKVDAPGDTASSILQEELEERVEQGQTG